MFMNVHGQTQGAMPPFQNDIVQYDASRSLTPIYSPCELPPPTTQVPPQPIVPGPEQWHPDSDNLGNVPGVYVDGPTPGAAQVASFEMSQSRT
jgi:hypothetical protein